jgi:hypothetical protein
LRVQGDLSPGIVGTQEERRMNPGFRERVFNVCPEQDLMPVRMGIERVDNPLGKCVSSSPMG